MYFTPSCTLPLTVYLINLRNPWECGTNEIIKHGIDDLGAVDTALKG